MPIASLFALTLLAAEPTVAAPGPAPRADTPPAAAKPRHKGTGLLVTSGVLGGTALVLTVTRNVLFKKNCPLSDGTTATKCTYDFGSDIGLAATQWGMNITNVGIAPGAGVMLARYHAWKDVETGKKRPIRTIMGAGGGVLGAGVAGLIGAVAMTFVLPKKCLDKELGSSDPLSGDRCLLKAYPAWTMLNWASFSMISAGAGMLAYGNAYKKSGGAVASAIQVSPFAGRGQAGLALSGRF
jgi:hypothetical protein